MAEIKGQVRIANGLVAEDFTFQLFRERFGADPELVATVETDGDGRFSVPNVEVGERATWSPRSSARVHPTSSSPTRRRAGPATMRLVVPTAEAAFASEYQRCRSRPPARGTGA
jgi:hypothetical protein